MYPYQTSHAVLVDLDGNGTMGMMASWIGPSNHFGQQLFAVYNDALIVLRPPQGWRGFAVSPAGRLVATTRANGGADTVRVFTLVEFSQGELWPVMSLLVHEVWNRGPDVYYPNFPYIRSRTFSMTYYAGDMWERNWDYDIPLTEDEFYAVLARHNLSGMTDYVWQPPDETEAILAMRTTTPRGIIYGDIYYGDIAISRLFVEPFFTLLGQPNDHREYRFFSYDSFEVSWFGWDEEEKIAARLDIWPPNLHVLALNGVPLDMTRAEVLTTFGNPIQHYEEASFNIHEARIFHFYIANPTQNYLLMVRFENIHDLAEITSITIHELF